MALENDTQAPDFELVNQYGETVRLSDFRGKKAVALVFFPLAFSGTCTGELCALRDNLNLFKDHAVELIGISVDSKYTLRAWAEQEDYDFALLADFWPHGEIAKEYGVFLQEKGFANRATFVIDESGIIRASFITAPGEARSIEAYRAALELLPAHVG
ncbi:MULTISPECIES: peroxiredoxin [unclassified Leifsonia]|uniref:peroxiredoxin n=1 Tax=unclassified Leifsonia TaxID=2663824 RepID=UPI000A19AB3F|nr:MULTISPECIES: peroxiredoxin [unclassified Leifsonia]QIZ98757.1 peroxiredoxin [Leifsonia sp. PS1209]